MRTKSIKCPVEEKQIGDRFEPSDVQHIRPADPGPLLQAEVTTKVSDVIIMSIYFDITNILTGFTAYTLTLSPPATVLMIPKVI